MDPLPGQIEFEAQRWPLRSLWLNPALCDSPVYRRGAKSNGKKNNTSDSIVSSKLTLKSLIYPQQIG